VAGGSGEAVNRSEIGAGGEQIGKHADRREQRRLQRDEQE
jgi:hypothetical protein